MSQGRCHVWVTRPQPGAEQTAARLEALGYEAFVAPLTEIVGVPADVSPLADCAALVFTSANGARFFPSDAAKALLSKPVFAVGQATADAVHALGFLTIVIGDSDASSLAPLIAERTEDGDAIGYITGFQRTGTLEQSLAALNRKAVLVEVYDTKKVSQITYDKSSFFETAAPRAILIYSQLSAEVLVSMVASGAIVQNIENARYIAISPRVADVLAPLGTDQIDVAAMPNEAAMFAALHAHVGGKAL